MTRAEGRQARKNMRLANRQKRRGEQILPRLVEHLDLLLVVKHMIAVSITLSKIIQVNLVKQKDQDITRNYEQDIRQAIR